MSISEQKGKGAIKKTTDLRDHKYHRLIAGGPQPFNWATAPQLDQLIRTQTTKIKDQGDSDSCGGQASAYYLGDLAGVEISARDIYSQVFVPGGGSDLRTILSLIVRLNGGVRTEADMTSYSNGQPPTEAFMESRMGATNTPLHRGTAYAFSKTDIETVASATRDCGGCILLIDERNNGTWDSEAPLPPGTSAEEEWRHFIRVKFAGWYNGKKAVAFTNSWGTGVGVGGWQILTEDHFIAGCIQEAGVLYDSAAYSYTPTALQTFAPPWLLKILSFLHTYLLTSN